MADNDSTITYSHKDLVAVLLKDQGICEGHWGVHLELSLAAGNIPVAATGETLALMPAGIVAVTKIGIHKYSDANPLTVDASQVNPATEASDRSPKPTRKASTPR